MKFTVETDQLKMATKTIETIFGRTDIAALFKINKKHELTIQCGEPNAWLMIKIPVSDEKEGFFTTEYGSIAKIGFPKKEVSFEANKKEIDFKSGTFKGKLSNILADNKVLKFKPLKLIKAKHKLNAKDLTEGISSLSYLPILIDKDTKCLTIRVSTNGEMIIATNDSYRGGIFKSVTKTKPFKVHMNFDSMKRIVSMIPDSGSISLGTNSKQIRIVTKTIDCQCPTFQIEKQSSAEELIGSLKKPIISFTSDAQKFSEAIASLSSLMYLSKTTELKIIATIKKSKLEMKASVGTGSASYSITIHRKTGKENTFNMNNRMVMDILTLLKGSVKLELFSEIGILSSTQKDIKYVFPLVQ